MPAIGASAFPPPAGAQPPAEAAPQPGQAAPAIPSVSAAYQDIEKQALQEVSGAAQERDKRLGDRDAWLNKAYQLSPIQRLFTSPEAYRDYSNIVEKHAQRRTDEAQLPLADVIHRTNARVEAMRQATEQHKLDVSDFESQQLMKTADGGSDESQLARNFLKTYAPGVAKAVPANISALALQPFFKASPDLGKAYESYKAGQKAGVEAGQVPLDAASKRALEAAQAEEAKAKAASERIKVSGEIYPGVSRGSQALSDKQVEDTNTKLRSTDELLSGLDRVEELLGDHNVAKEPGQRGRIKTELNQLTAKMMQSDQFKRLTEVDKNFFGESFFGDPNKLTNAVWPQAKAKLSEARRALSTEAMSHIRGHGLNITDAVRQRYDRHHGGTVKMRTPKGKTVDVPASEVANAPKGWTASK